MYHRGGSSVQRRFVFRPSELVKRGVGRLCRGLGDGGLEWSWVGFNLDFSVGGDEAGTKGIGKESVWKH